MKVKELAFCFENLEQFIVPIEYVEFYIFDDIHTNISSFDNNFREMQVASEILVCLKQEADKKAVSTFDNISSPKLFDRLSIYRDCVGVDIVMENDERKEIYGMWKDDGDDYTNAYQHTFIQENEEVRGYKGFCVHIGKTMELMNL